MKVTLESTAEVLTHKTPDGSVPVRLWEGRTERGVDVVAYIVEIRAVHLNQDWLLKEEQGDELTQREPTRREVLLKDQEEGRIVEAPPRNE